MTTIPARSTRASCPSLVRSRTLMAEATPLDEVLEEIPVLAGRARDVSELPGGLTNATTRSSRTPAPTSCGAGATTRACSRSTATTSTRTRSPPPRWAWALPVVAYLPEHNTLVFEFVDGRTLSAETLRDRGPAGRVADACRRLHGARRFRDDFDMFDDPAALPGDRARARLPAARRATASSSRRWRRSRRRSRCATRAPCPATTTCWPRTSSTPATRLRLIDYEYSGNNDA